MTSLIGESEIAARVATLASEVAAGMGRDPLVIAILRGSFVFAADLIRALHRAGMRPQVDFLTLSSYGDRTVGHKVRVVRDLADDPSGREVLLVDDILESGRTIAAAREMLVKRGTRSVRLCVLLQKPDKLKVPITADFCGFQVPDRFVVGYGLDHARHYRDLPYIGTVEID